MSHIVSAAAAAQFNSAAAAAHSNSAAAAAPSKPFIDWAALGEVAYVSLIFGVGVVVLFSVGIVGLSIARGHDRAETSVDGGVAPPVAGNRGVGSLLAGVCLVVCAAAVLYGLYLIVPQFHR